MNARHVLCNYCKRPAEMVPGDVLYEGRSDLRLKMFYLCRPCDAYVGCHQNTSKPLGTLAKSYLRKLRRQCHDLLDAFWLDGSESRNDSYRWLAEQLGINIRSCHIGWFDEEMCKKTIEACTWRFANATGDMRTLESDGSTDEVDNTGSD